VDEKQNWRAIEDTPEGQLLLQILFRACNDYFIFKEGSETFREVEAWLFRRSAFEDTCYVLRIHLEKFRFSLNIKKDQKKTIKQMRLRAMEPAEFDVLLDMCRM